MAIGTTPETETGMSRGGADRRGIAPQSPPERRGSWLRRGGRHTSLGGGVAHTPCLVAWRRFLKQNWNRIRGTTADVFLRRGEKKQSIAIFKSIGRMIKWGKMYETICRMSRKGLRPAGKDSNGSSEGPKRYTPGRRYCGGGRGLNADDKKYNTCHLIKYNTFLYFTYEITKYPITI